MSRVKTPVKLFSFLKSASLLFSQIHFIEKVFKTINPENNCLESSQKELEDSIWLESNVSNLDKWENDAYSDEELDELQSIQYVPGKGLVIG